MFNKNNLKTLGAIFLSLIFGLRSLNWNFRLGFSDLSIVVTTLAVVLLAYIVIVIFAKTSTQNIYGILDEECDPERFLSLYDEEKHQSKSDAHWILTKLTRADAFTALGNFEKAKNIYDYIEPNNIESDELRAMYYLNLSDLHVHTNNIEEAKKSLSYAKSYDYNTANFKAAAKFVDADIKRKEGNLRESRAIFTELSELKQSKRFHLDCIFRLALIDASERKIEAAQQKLRKVKAEGNKLRIVSLAEIGLKKLETIS